jgi:hypothetical protein
MRSGWRRVNKITADQFAAFSEISIDTKKSENLLMTSNNFLKMIF